jgi:hypothetical protein
LAAGSSPRRPSRTPAPCGRLPAVSLDAFYTRVAPLVGIEPVGIGVGLLVTWGLGVGAGFAVRRVRIQQPPWLQGIGRRHAPRVLGWLERTFFFAAIWLNQPLGIGAWLAFKVATKWNAWTMLGKIPDDLGGYTDADRTRSRAEWAAYVNNRLLIGTLYNVLCGIAGAAAGWLVIRLCASLST